MEQKISPKYPIEIKNEPFLPTETSVQAKPDEAVNFPPFQNSIVKEELILDDDELPNPEPDPEPSFQQSTVIVTSGFEITLMQDEHDPDQTDHLVAVKEEEPQPSQETTTTALLRCGRCKKHFTRAKSYQVHCQRHQNIEARRFLCKPCGKPFGMKLELARHEWLVHGLKRKEPADNRFQCKNCGKHLGSKDELVRHEFQKHGKTIKAEPTEDTVEIDDQGHFKCPECTKTFTQWRLALRHMRRHKALDEGAYQCKVCGKFYSGNAELRKHARRKHNETQMVRKVDPLEKDADGNFKCTKCPQTFPLRSQCSNHIRKHRILESATYQCKKCQKCFFRPKELERHEQATTKTAKTQCLKYQKLLKLDISNLPEKSDKESHIRENMRQKVDALERDENGHFKCPKCPQTFPTRSQCLPHIRKHRILENATYQCKKCQKCFLRPKELEKHEQATTKTAKTQCVKYQKLLKLDISKLPEKSDEEKTAKEYHIREENGTFICSSCNMIFLQRRRCVAHIRRHVDIDNERFKCGTCGMVCGTNKELQRHKVNKHGATNVKSMRPDPASSSKTIK